jgi:hemolysin III
MKIKNISGYTHTEEIANVATHLLGVIFSIYVLISLLNQGFSIGSKSLVVSYIIYSLSLFALYTSSTLYHLVKSESKKKLFKKLDHICIYYLIAGSYTPLMLYKVGGDIGILITTLVWLIAILGTFYKLFSKKNNKIISTFSYLLMGWIVAFFWPKVSPSLSSDSIFWLAIGGVLYSVGVIFYSLKKVPYTHAIWHLFVLAGSFAHYLSIRVA